MGLVRVSIDKMEPRTSNSEENSGFGSMLFLLP